MNNVRVTQLDGALPNLALMRLSHWHKRRGDKVNFTRTARRELFEPEYAAVYGSAIFKFTADKIARFKSAFPDAILGGTGTDSLATVEHIIGDHAGLDYEPWPTFDASIGFTQRGCRLSCKFCVVPKKEGKPQGASTIADIWRGGPWPKHIHLLDNDFFGGPLWQDRIAEIRDGGFKVSFTQGINVRAMTPEVAAAVAGVEYRNNKFNRRILYTAWDNLKDEEVFFRGVDMLEAAGVPAKNLMAFMLVGFDKKETWERIHHRFDRMVARGIKPYPMPFDQKRRDLKQFQRWAVTGLYRAIPFDQYDVSFKRRPSDGSQHRDLFSTDAKQPQAPAGTMTGWVDMEEANRERRMATNHEMRMEGVRLLEENEGFRAEISTLKARLREMLALMASDIERGFVLNTATREMVMCQAKEAITAAKPAPQEDKR